MAATDRPPFSYPVKIANLSANAVDVRLAADERECAAIAATWNVLAVKDLSAELHMARWKKDGVKIRGHVKAHIVQACVVTLEPVESFIDEPLDVVLVPEGSRLARIAANDSGEMILSPDGPDLPDTFVGDAIDVGDVVAEHAAFAIDPYPRKEGVEFSGHIESTQADDERRNPFAALKALKKDE